MSDRTIQRLVRLGFVFSLLFAVSAEAAMHKIKFCLHVRASFDDSGWGEDIYTSRTAYYDARYTRARVMWGSGYTSTLWIGYLDSSGCTPYLDIGPNVSYKISYGTKVQRTGGRNYYVLSTSKPCTSTSYTWYNAYYTAPSEYPEPLLYVPINIYQGSETAKTRSTAVGIRVMRKYSTLGFPSNYKLKFKLIEEGGNRYDRSEKCIYMRESSTDEKFACAHEVGHALGDVENYHLIAGSTSLYNPVNGELCSCKHADGDGPGVNEHCLQSQEEIHKAQVEGWAHFISTATFNYRGQSVNKFVYYQPIKYSSTYTKQDPAPVDPADRRRWNETKCWVSGTNHTGVEWDWLTFFYRIWNSGTYRLDVDEIRDIWPRDGASDSDYYWTAILNSAQSKLSPSEFNNFYTEGDLCGVNH